MDERLDELVLRAVELVPWGHVVSYGDLGHVVGIGPRRVGSVLSRHGGGVAWWRVTNAAGDFPPDLLVQAVPHWHEEGIALRPTGRGCRIADHRADLVELERRWRVAAADVLAEAEAEDEAEATRIGTGEPDHVRRMCTPVQTCSRVQVCRRRATTSWGGDCVPPTSSAPGTR